ncbi:MAG: TRAP transporter large permease subunit [Burkholderiaceae bacterium]
MSAALLGLVGLFALIFARVPIAVSLAVVGFVGFSLEVGVEPALALVAHATKEGTLNFELSVVPLFVLMGNLIARARLSDELYAAAYAFLGHLKGGLALATIAACGGFSAVCGSSMATAATMAKVSMPSMRRYNYDDRLATGAIAAGGTLGILIPPSIMLVVMGPVLEVPVTSLFAAAIVPGILLALLFTGYAMVRCWFDPSLGPPLPKEARPANMREVWSEFFKGLVPPAALVLAALGSIVFGFATPTEGAGCGAFGALLLTLAYRKLTWSNLKDAMVKTLEISVLILFLVAASNFFGAVFARLGTPTMLTELLLGLDLNRYVLLALIMALIFLLGWPLEWVPIVLIVVPFLLPLITKLGFDLTWFGILVAVNLQTAWLSPPVALSAYFLKGVVPQWNLTDIYKGMMQFMVLQLIALILIIAFPQIALWLPELIYGK